VALVSVIIPVKNRRRVLRRAIASVARQTLKPDSVVVVDDGSDDGTAHDLDNLQLGINLRVFRQEPSSGAAAARNRGISETSSEFVAFLDSDDEWKDDKLRLQIEFLTRHPAYCACFCQFVHQHPRGEYLSGTKGFDVNESMLFCRNVIGSTSTAVVRRSALEAVGYFDPTLPSCQDWDLWLKLAQLGPLRVLPDALLVYHYDEENRISGSYERVMEGLEIVFERVRHRVSEQDSKQVIARQRLLLSSLHTSRWPDWRRVISYGVEAISTSPSLPMIILFVGNMIRYSKHKLGTLSVR
jgi:glycosyltransferase involved in cell wall biosynthesis